jgi:hypothetical protein
MKRFPGGETGERRKGEGGQIRVAYFIVGVSLALCACVGQTLHPDKLTFLSAYTIEVVSLALLILSAGVGLKRIESLVQISRLNGLLLPPSGRAVRCGDQIF